MTIGERIKKFRTTREMSQKQLAVMSGISEPAIRNYELENRRPNQKQIEKIAGVLEISAFAISDPGFETYDGLIHALFQIEDQYDLTPDIVGGRMVFRFEQNHTMTDHIELWVKEQKKLKNGEITKEEYDLWRYSFSRLQTEKEAPKRRKCSAKKLNEE